MRIALYGTGPWAAVHAQAWNGISSAELVGVAGYSNQSRLDFISHTYDIPEKSLSWRKLLHETQPDFADIVVSPVCRVDAVRAAVETPSVKVINIEKPWSLKPSDAREIQRLGKTRNIRITVNHQKKLLPSWQKAREIISSGLLGSIQQIRATCGGTTAEQGTHIIDMVLELLNRPLLSSITGQLNEYGRLEEEHLAPGGAICNIEFRDACDAYLAFGSRGFDLPRENAQYSQMGVQIMCEQALLEVSLTAGLWIKYFEDGRIETDTRGWNEHFMEAQQDHLLKAMSSIEHDRGWHLSDIRYAQDAFDIVMGIYASSVDCDVTEFPAIFSDRLIDFLMLKRPSYKVQTAGTNSPSKTEPPILDDLSATNSWMLGMQR